MKKFIVTTTINKPTKALKKFAKLKDWKLVIVGDLKTPKNFFIKDAIYLKPADQEKIDLKLSNLIGWNCIQRRNFGYIYAYKNGADLIATVDDDNIPLPNWGKDIYINKLVTTNFIYTNMPVSDPIFVTDYKYLWHRGYPLDLINKRRIIKKTIKKIKPSVQADFWNGDPDIDAVCRLIYKPNCNFKSKFFPFVFNSISPFNSQNTFLSRNILKYYFLFPGIGRMDDIWASYYLQHKVKLHVIYQKPTVIQERNKHDLIKDFKAEIIGYENNLRLINELQKDPENIKHFIPETSYLAFKLYQKHFD